MAKQLNNLPLHRSVRIQQRQGSCLGGFQSTLVERESDVDRGGPNVDPELWGSCRGRDDGRLMICCDQQGENCNVWYHYDFRAYHGRRSEDWSFWWGLCLSFLPPYTE